MKGSILRGPLIKSAFLLVIFSLLVYFTSTSPEGNIWHAVGMIFVSVFKIAQLSVGLALSLALCLMVLCGIFLGSVAMVSKESASGMYQHLLGKLQAFFSFFHIKKCSAKRDAEEAFKGEINGIITTRLNEMKKAQAEHYLQICSLVGKIEQLEKRSAMLVSSEQLEEELTDIDDKNDKVAAEIAAAVKAAGELEKKLAKLTPESFLGDLPAKVKVLEEQGEQSKQDVQEGQDEAVELLNRQLDELRTELDGLKAELEVSGSGAAENNKTLHRLCSYFSEDSDCDQLEESVAETLSQDMTYAQVGEYVIDKLREEAAVVVKEHPALLKDYIRQRRKEYLGN